MFPISRRIRGHYGDIYSFKSYLKHRGIYGEAYSCRESMQRKWYVLP
jgi:hypothetical protein